MYYKKQNDICDYSILSGFKWVDDDNKEPSTLVRRVRPHIRSGHFHGFWSGTAQNKTYNVKWLPAIFVNSLILRSVSVFIPSSSDTA